MKKRWILLSLLCFILCGFVYCDSFSGKFDVLKADYYLKANQKEKAAEFYEKAIDSGDTSLKARNNYVKILTELPADIKTQERLLKITKSPIYDEAQYMANSYLYDLRYEIFRKYPDNHITQATYNQNIVHWADGIITYGYVNPDKAPEYYLVEIENAFLTWEDALNEKLDKKFQFKKTDRTPQIVIRFNNSKTIAGRNEKFVAAKTEPIINSNYLKNMVIDYYLTSPDGENFSQNQVYNTALHEIGHALGFMGHSDNSKNIMYMSTDNITVSNDLRKSLSDSDINTIKLLYLIKPDITNKQSPKGEYLKEIVLGNETETSNAKMREARTYIKKAPNLPNGYIDLADAYVTQKEYEKAVKCLDKALMLAKDNDTLCMIYYNLAITNFYLSNYEEAKSYLEKSGQYKNTETAQRLMAQIYSETGGKIEAVNLYEDLISKHPSNIDYVIALTNIYVKDRAYLKARSVLKNFMKNNPSEKNNPIFAPYGILRIFL